MVAVRHLVMKQVRSGGGRTFSWAKSAKPSVEWDGRGVIRRVRDRVSIGKVLRRGVGGEGRMGSLMGSFKDVVDGMMRRMMRRGVMRRRNDFIWALTWGR